MLSGAEAILIFLIIRSNRWH